MSRSVPGPVVVQGRRRGVVWGVLALAVCAIGVRPVCAQTGELESVGAATSFNSVVGSGARAWGMGGAFIATADDGTAASWNPAGLVQSPRAMITASWVPYAQSGFISPGYEQSESDEGVTSQLSVTSLAGETHASWPDYLSFSYPFLAGNWRWVVQAGYQRAINLNYSGDSGTGYGVFSSTDTDFDDDGTADIVDEASLLIDGSFDGGGGYDVYSASVAAGTSKFSIGLAVNYWDANYTRSYQERGHGRALSAISGGPVITAPFTYAGTIQQKYDVDGWNVNLGFLYKPSAKWAVGLVYKSAFELEGTWELDNSVKVTLGEEELPERSEARADATIEWPTTIGAGVAYKPIELLRLEFDVTQTNWSGNEARHSGKLSTNSPSEDGSTPIDFSNGFPTGTDYQTDSRQYRFGAEYLLQASDKVQVPLRGGYFVDTQPRTTIDGDSVNFNGYSFGTGIQVGGVYVDLAYVRSQGDYDGYLRTGETERRSDSLTQVYLTAVYRFSKLGS